MSTDQDKGPPDRRAEDRLWRFWVSIAAGTFVVASLLVGLVVLPLREEARFDPWGAICRAIGIRKDAPTATGKSSDPPASSVTWSEGTRLGLLAANPASGGTIVKDTCAACHGEAGVSVDPQQFPNLAGQTQEAIFKQLRDFQTGARTSDIMAPIAQALTEAQTKDVAAYFAAQKPVEAVGSSPSVSANIVELAHIGAPARGIPSCYSCHGQSRSGPEEAPVLFGQSASYLEDQLKKFASAERRNDMFARMRTIAKQLSPEEMHGMAMYYGNSRPAKP
ncbi:c-type cytochrome [Hyphomicrobium sp.]|uniref:c-type cytochrome n=1 Tax=Hyphomicrobium sp. TaxID=82 RepID=UPI001DE23E18|nr:c-type cytochrome [Hyphomicrobium sp.]MBY0561124.1 c-type cytochrome [Hyphomicrobium sp.]